MSAIRVESFSSPSVSASPPPPSSGAVSVLKSVINRESGPSSSAKRHFKVRRPKDRNGTTPRFTPLGVSQQSQRKEKTVYTLARKFVQPRDDGDPLPGSLEEDLTATPETFFSVVPERKSPRPYSSISKQWGRLDSADTTRRPEHIAQQQQLVQSQLSQERAEPMSVRFKEKRSPASIDASSRDGGGKGRSASKKNLKKLDMQDEDIESKYAGIMARLRGASQSSGSGARNMQAFRSTKQERFFDTHRQAQQRWERQLKSACGRLGRKPEDSVVSRADGYREKVEKVAALEMATPSEIKYGAQNWYMSLRCSSLFKDVRHYSVHVGNSYTGLWIQITDNPNKQAEIIRKPTRLVGNYKTFKDNPFLQDKIRKETKRLNEISPARDDQIEGLQVPARYERGVDFRSERV